MDFKKCSWLSSVVPFISWTTIPTSMHDKRLANYKPKITDKDFEYNPLTTQIVHEYKSELTKNKDTSGATLIDDGLSAFVIRAAFARMATKTIDLQTYIYSS